MSGPAPVEVAKAVGAVTTEQVIAAWRQARREHPRDVEGCRSRFVALLSDAASLGSRDNES